MPRLFQLWELMNSEIYVTLKHRYRLTLKEWKKRTLKLINEPSNWPSFRVSPPKTSAYTASIEQEVPINSRTINDVPFFRHNIDSPFRYWLMVFLCVGVTKVMCRKEIERPDSLIPCVVWLVGWWNDETAKKFRFIRVGGEREGEGLDIILIERAYKREHIRIKVYIENHPQSRDIINKFPALLFLPSRAPFFFSTTQFFTKKREKKRVRERRTAAQKNISSVYTALENDGSSCWCDCSAVKFFSTAKTARKAKRNEKFSPWKFNEQSKWKKTRAGLKKRNEEKRKFKCELNYVILCATAVQWISQITIWRGKKNTFAVNSVKIISLSFRA